MNYVVEIVFVCRFGYTSFFRAAPQAEALLFVASSLFPLAIHH